MSGEKHFWRATTFSIGDRHSGVEITSKQDLDDVKSFFKEGGASVKADPANPEAIIIEPSFYLIATSTPYTIYEDDIGDDLWVKFAGKECNSGLFAYRSQVIYVVDELVNYLQQKRDASFDSDTSSDYEERCRIVPRCRVF